MNDRHSTGPVSTGRRSEGIPAERGFRLGLTIQDESGLPGAHASLALLDEEGKDTPLLSIMAGGFPATDEGARMLAGMLEDAAEAIYEKVGRPAVRTDTAELPVVHRPAPAAPEPPKPAPRPRFNPQPRSAGK